MNCTRCEGIGFINIHQVPEEMLAAFDATGDHNIIQHWIDVNNDHDVSVCDCCGDGENWYGEPGEHNYRKGGDEPIPGCS